MQLATNRLNEHARYKRGRSRPKWRRIFKFLIMAFCDLWSSFATARARLPNEANGVPERSCSKNAMNANRASAYLYKVHAIFFTKFNISRVQTQTVTAPIHLSLLQGSNNTLVDNYEQKEEIHQVINCVHNTCARAVRLLISMHTMYCDSIKHPCITGKGKKTRENIRYAVDM